jgi:hypothetical protein
MSDTRPCKAWTSPGLRRGVLGATALAAGALPVAACSSGSSDHDTGSDAALAGDSARGADEADAPESTDAVASDAFTGSMQDGGACVLTENDAGTCNALTASGPMILATCTSATPPEPQGGAILDGTYILDAFVHYGGCPATPDIASTTWALCGDRWDVAQLVPADPEDAGAGTLPILRLNFTTTVANAMVDYTLVCQNIAASDLPQRGYTVSGNHLTFIYPDPVTPGATEVSDYTRQ